MGFRLPHIFAFLTLALVASHAALPPQLYWKTALPNTPMPKSLSELLQPADLMEDKSTSVEVGKGGVNVQAGKGTHVSVGKGGVSVSTGQKYILVRGPGINPFRHYAAYTRVYSASEINQLHEDPGVSLFFLEKDMHPGTTKNLQLTGNSKTASFLPRTTAELIPFSSNKLPDILNQFSVTPGSVAADTIKKIIEECEIPGIREDKYCATSLESMIDFSISKLGRNIQAISTEVKNGTTMQKYTIAPGVKKIAGDKSVVCHKQNYVYAVFYCHAIKATRVYTVPLEGAAGESAKAVAVCHTDTSDWNPKHLAFQVLKVKPGTVPICHFLPKGHIVWVLNYAK